MANLEEQFNEQILKGTVPVNDQNLQQALIETAVLDDLNDVNISSPTNGQILGYNSGTNSWQNTNATIADGDKGDITTSGGGSTWTIDNDVVTNSKLANMATARVKGRATAGTGDPEDLVIDNDLSTVSANDDTIPSAKAVKDYVDILELKTRLRNGGLLNGFIRVTVASNNLTVAISTSSSSQVDPTAANPVYVWIGDTLRSITGALSITANGGTNWLNMGGAELAIKEVDLFPFMQWNSTTSAVNILISRLPYPRLMGDFTNSGIVDKGVFGIVNYNATDDVVNVGRFAATLSAGAGYTWTVPTFDNANLIQEPVYETRSLSWQPTYSGSGSMTYTSVTTTEAFYRVLPNGLYRIQLFTQGTTGGTGATALQATLPFEGGAGARQRFTMISQDDTTSGVAACSISGNVLGVSNYPNGAGTSNNFTLGTNRRIMGNAIIEIR